MALVFKDRVRVTSTTTGTGTFTLGSAVSGFQDFSVIGNGNTTYYSITDQAGNWEVGIGTYTSSGTTLSRTTIIESSNSGSVVDFPAGTKNVFVTYPAEKSVGLDASDELTTVVSIAKGGTGQTSAANAINALLPTQTGNDGKFLKTNGSAVSWDTPSGGSSAKTWTAFTATGTYTVPAGVSSIRAYAIGAGGNGAAGSISTSGGAGGGGGGCAYGDIAVTAGQTVTVTISSGVATVSYGGTTMLTGNAGTNASGSTNGTGGSASKDASVTNGGAYSGGAGGAGNVNDFLGGGGGSAGSPLGNGYAGGNGSGTGTGGGGGIGGAGGYGGGGGAGGAGGDNGSGGSGGAGTYTGGIGRSLANAFSDPLLSQCFGAGASFNGASWTSNISIVSGAPGQYGGGGGSAINSINNSAYGGNAGAFGGGGQAYTYGTAGCRGGNGGFMGGGGRAAYAGYSVGGNGGYGGGGGGATGTTAAPATAGSGGGAVVLIYA